MSTTFICELCGEQIPPSSTHVLRETVCIDCLAAIYEPFLPSRKTRFGIYRCREKTPAYDENGDPQTFYLGRRYLSVFVFGREFRRYRT